MSRSSLRDRMYGYQFSGVEYSILFDNTDLGFAKRIPSIPNTFHLSPSPFYEYPTEHYYIFPKDPLPEENTLIQVLSKETEKRVEEGARGVQNAFLHYVKSWERKSPSKLIRRELISKEEYIDYFKTPFNGDITALETLGNVMGITAVSSPKSLLIEAGGMNSAIFGKSKDWNAYKRLLSVIPEEFLLQRSDISYQFINKPLSYQKHEGKEINLSLQNPESTPVHMPIQLTSRRFDVDMNPLSEYVENLNIMQPLVAGRLIDSLMFQPTLQKSLEKPIANAVYTLSNEISLMTEIPYNQELGSIVPKLSTAIARFNLTEKTSKTDIKTSVSMWEDMFYFTVRSNESKNAAPATSPRMSRESSILHGEILSAFPTDTKVPLDEVRKISKHDKASFDAALYDLHHRGKVLLLNNDQSLSVYILDSKKTKNV